MKSYFCLIAVCAAALLSSCAMRGPDILPPSSSVTRQEALAISNAYTSLRWKPGKKNAFHGVDPTGIRVDTADKKKGDESSCYWVPGEYTTGMAYKWGGFDTPKEFMIKIQSTYHPALVRNPAGDIATDEKIRLGDDAVSPYAAGIDCSGFISRCWRLSKPYSTRELPGLCVRLKSVYEMQTGDILILPGVHVVMFIKWVDAGKTCFEGSDAGGSKFWRVNLRRYPLRMFVKDGYKPMRYKNMTP